jgi:hypothetical protein
MWIILNRLKKAATSLTRRIFKRSAYRAIVPKPLKSKEIMLTTKGTMVRSNGTWNTTNIESHLYGGDGWIDNQDTHNAAKIAQVVLASRGLVNAVIDFETTTQTRIMDMTIKDIGELYVDNTIELTK